MEHLRRFNGDVNTKEALLAFSLSQVDEYALEKLYKGVDVAGMKHAREAITRAFEQIEIIYAIPERTGEQENTSR